MNTTTAGKNSSRRGAPNGVAFVVRVDGVVTRTSSPKANFVAFARRTILLVLASLVLLAAPANAQQLINREKELKAGYLFMFAHHVQWPANNNRTFDIGVLGENTLDKWLLALPRQPFKKPIRVRLFKVGQAFQPCDILFVSQQPVLGDKRNHDARMAEAVALIGNQPCLLVSEVPGAKGAAISYSVNRGANRIVLEVDPVNAKAQRLTIGARLLALQANGAVRIVRRPAAPPAAGGAAPAAGGVAPGNVAKENPKGEKVNGDGKENEDAADNKDAADK